VAPPRALIAAADPMPERFGSADVAGELRLGSPEDFASVDLPGNLATFSAAHPAWRCM